MDFNEFKKRFGERYGDGAYGLSPDGKEILFFGDYNRYRITKDFFLNELNETETDFERVKKQIANQHTISAENELEITNKLLADFNKSINMFKKIVREHKLWKEKNESKTEEPPIDDNRIDFIRNVQRKSTAMWKDAYEHPPTWDMYEGGDGKAMNDYLTRADSLSFEEKTMIERAKIDDRPEVEQRSVAQGHRTIDDPESANHPNAYDAAMTNSRKLWAEFYDSDEGKKKKA